MPIIRLYEGDTGTIYNLEVSEKDAIKADRDMVFATQLLQRFKSAQETQFTKSAEKTATIVKDAENSRSHSITESACYDMNQTTQEFSESSQEAFDFQEKNSFRWPHEAVLLLLTLYKEHED
ncbi:PREDICTED: uncharacterized protein LOC108764164 isoform X1 [Trachymyrmex cornetzi]|uniref:uncharacterized protein LOC108764164 isoform X1 n=1 Tax=Trachymyrmex cornetzi TaxID=471704 RepID=UPI00084F0698|nr:PREDICTED: uncharacterized protein LOC108764164 isoform X1 [Trachymyrmex cornetzi]